MLKRDERRYFNGIIAETNNDMSFASATMPQEVMKRCFNELKNEAEELLVISGPGLFNYSSINGDDLLRQRLVSSGLAGENSNKNMVTITNGGQEAIKLTVEAILNSGERVMSERVSYTGLEQIVLSSKGKIVGFSDELNNLKLSDIEEEIKKNKPKLLYLVPDINNPCGDILRDEVRRLLVKLARELSFWIIEDQTLRELCFDINKKPTSMFSRSKKVVIVGSISKMVVPGLRVGWVVTKNDWLREKILRLKESSTLSTSTFDQRLVARLLMGGYERTVKWVRNYYFIKMKLMLENLEKKMPKGFSWIEPKGGFLIWVRGPENFEAKKALVLALKNGVSFVPGEVFYYGEKKLNTFRLSIHAIDMLDIAENVERLAETLRGKKVANRERDGWGWIGMIRSIFRKRVLNLFGRV